MAFSLVCGCLQPPLAQQLEAQCLTPRATTMPIQAQSQVDYLIPDFRESLVPHYHCRPPFGALDSLAICHHPAAISIPPQVQGAYCAVSEVLL